MKLSTLQATLVDVFVDETQGAAIAARYRHLGQMSFPPMPAQGRGQRIDYGVDELLAVALVFQLGEAFMSPGVAVRIVVSAWPELVAGLARIAAGNEGRPVLEIAPSGLADIGGANTSDQGAFHVAFLSVTEEWGPSRVRTRSGERDVRIRICIDGPAFCKGVAAGLRKAEPQVGARFAEELEASLGRLSPAGGHRLSERDFFFQRALRLLSDEEVRAAVAEERPLLVDRMLGDLLSYLSDPLPREAGRRLEAVDGVGEGFGVALDALLSALGVRGARAAPVREAAALRAAGPSLADFHRRLLDHAETRASELAAPAPSAATATRRRAARGG